MKYKVSLRREAYQHADIIVDADSVEQAKELAIEAIPESQWRTEDWNVYRRKIRVTPLEDEDKVPLAR